METSDPLEGRVQAARSAPDIACFIQPGDTVIWGQSHAEPRRLIGLLASQRHRIGGRIRIFLGIGLGAGVEPAHADTFDLLAYCGTGSNRALVQAGVLDILPSHYSQLPRLIRSGPLRADVVMLRVPPPDALGRYSLGMAREYLVDALATARVLMAEVDPQAPWTYGGPYLREEDFDCLIPANALPAEDASAMPGEVEQAIARHVADLVEDGATLQAGIGTLPDAILGQLVGKRELGIHSGSLGEGVALLQETGVITNSAKSIDPGITVGGVLIGGERLRRFAHLNPAVELRGTDYTHHPRVLGSIDRFVAINSAVEVDLTGQLNCEVAGGRYAGALGGIGDFLRAALHSPGGVPIVALPSTAGRHSRIVASLSGPTTVSRGDAGVIVTEQGIADLRGLTLAQRIPRMIAIAHPAHRATLERDFEQLGRLAIAL